jgi:hypothetical protein
MEGVPAKGMLSWKTQLPVGQILTLAAYVDTLKGTNPPNSKAAQGDRFDATQREALEARADEEIVANAPKDPASPSATPGGPPTAPAGSPKAP